uniref:Uncharacterized protein n=1 Tax=Ditylenchus dipsaci TaxID=166011 RepID=A0A915E4J2_9BILA
MFAGAVEKCHKKFQDAQSLCYESTPFFIAFFTCRHMNSLNLCQPSKMTSAANQLKLNIHFKAVEEPENEWIRALNEIEVTVQNHVDWFKMALGVFKDILSGFLVFIVYWVFRGNVNAITSYLSDIRFKNNARNKAWKYWSHCKRGNYRQRIDVSVWMANCEELRATWVSFLRWSVIFLVALVVVVVDYYYYRVLVHQRRAYTRNHCRRRGTYCGNDQGYSQFQLFYKTLEELTNAVCLSNRCHLIAQHLCVDIYATCGYACLAGSVHYSHRSSDAVLCYWIYLQEANQSTLSSSLTVLQSDISKLKGPKKARAETQLQALLDTFRVQNIPAKKVSIELIDDSKYCGPSKQSIPVTPVEEASRDSLRMVPVLASSSRSHFAGEADSPTGLLVRTSSAWEALQMCYSDEEEEESFTSAVQVVSAPVSSSAAMWMPLQWSFLQSKTEEVESPVFNSNILYNVMSGPADPCL